ncbi:MAG: 3-dehydroquinate synthase [Chitinivibrionales bacterium]|nr:3-dehydroquinate synthase [Chitinivibrionales bacterium]
MQQIVVALGDRSYPVFIGSDTFKELAVAIKKEFHGARFALVTNTTIQELYRSQIEQLQHSLDALVYAIPDGEKYKTIDTWSGILDTLLENRLERSSVIIAFGGGVVGDITGFAAASFLRGVKYIQIPTTLLAMVDSSVGGKTAVNHRRGKNLIGAFHQPGLVWVDTAYLSTLPEREFIAGYAELYKYAFIGGKEMFDFVMEHHDDMIAKKPGILQEGIRRSIAVKARIVSDDERERGNRALLNFGHTFAHALENYYNYEKILHGEAVLWGIACACDLGVRIGTVPEDSRKAYEALLKKPGMPELPDTPDCEHLYDAMFSDKKVSGGKIRFIVPTSPGKSIIKSDIDRNAIIATLTRIFKTQPAND